MQISCLSPYCPCGIRTPFEQAIFWRQSRTGQEVAQKIAELKGAGAPFLAYCFKSVGPQNGKPVTNNIPGLSWHQWREAVDCVWVVDGKSEWSTVKKVNDSNGYAVYARESKVLGLDPAGLWKDLKKWVIGRIYERWNMYGITEPTLSGMKFMHTGGNNMFKAIKMWVLFAVILLPVAVHAESVRVKNFKVSLLETDISGAFGQYSAARNTFNSPAVDRKDCKLKKDLKLMEEGLRGKAKEAMKKIKVLNAVSDGTSTAGVTKEAEKAKKELQTSIDKVSTELAVNDPDSLFVNHDDYDYFFFKFSLGVQYDSVKTAFSKGHPRLGLLVYDRLMEPVILDDDRDFGWYGMHTLISALYTSSGEVDTTNNGIVAQGKVNLADKNALQIDLPLFVPFYRTPKHARNAFWEYTGIYGLLGGVKTDDSNKVDYRHYIGIRNAINPECYFDILYGKTDSLRSDRLELRGQIPIYRTTENTLLFLGINANVTIGNKQEKEADIVSTYVSWNVDVKDIFSLFNAKAK